MGTVVTVIILLLMESSQNSTILVVEAYPSREAFLPGETAWRDKCRRRRCEEAVGADREGALVEQTGHPLPTPQTQLCSYRGNTAPKW